MTCWLLALLLLVAPAARAQDAAEIVRRAEDALRGNTAEMKLRMTITTPRWTRELVVRSWDDRAHDRSFTRVLEPPKDKGTAFLREKDAFWTWLPRVERAMRIPPSMMLQSWMGSDFTNDDLA
ncbi:MAG TPA: outer membrane lipoprotein-sorting protein, partial [Myxococcota bacterium]|nr:outer membrane lipoprotein-sorting protein [Myxococcota bacterium]